MTLNAAPESAVDRGVRAAHEPNGAPVAAVDFSVGKGLVKRLNGVCNGLKMTQMRDAALCEQFAALEVSEIRFHDQAGTNGGQAIVDISRVFPLAHADENDPRNYDFRATDDYISYCLRFTSAIEFRIGEQIEHSPSHYRVFPPKDCAKYARICLNVVRHLNDGWANGHHYGIRRWGIWEEPDNRRLFDGDYEKEYFPLYAAIATTLKAAYPDLAVGGPATRGREMFRAEKFVAYCRAHQVPLDFCAVTDYRRSIETILDIGAQTRRILDTNGFTKAEVSLAEWHYEPAIWSGTTPETAKRAWDDATGIDSGAFSAGLLLAGQDSAYDRMFYYATDVDYWSLFDFRECRRVAPWSAFKAFADAARLTNRVETASDVKRGFYALATKGRNGQGALVLAAFRSPQTGPVRVSVRGGLVPGEVLVDAGERVRRFVPVAGWRFADGVLTLPPAGPSAIWFVGFGDYRARRLKCDRPTAKKTIPDHMDFRRSKDGKLDFAVVVDAKNRPLTEEPLRELRETCHAAYGDVPDVYGDNDSEKMSQATWLVAFGDSTFARAHGADISKLRDGEYLLQSFEKGVLVVGRDAAANAKALKAFAQIAARNGFKIPCLGLRSGTAAR